MRRAISATRRGDGNKQLVPAWISGPLRRSFLTLTERLGLCCSPRLGQAAASLSRRCQHARSSRCRMTPSAACSCGACASHCLPLRWRPRRARAACPTAGVLVRRACPLERAAARICREAGARVATNVFLRDLNLGLPLTDGRRLEVVAHGLPAFGGVQVAVDVTLVSPLRRDGSSRSRADHEPGLALRTAAKRKHRVTYPEFQRARRCRLTVLALEVGGRWGEETEAFLHRIAQGRALASPAAQRTAVAAAYRRRWGQMLAVAAQGAFAASLTLPTPHRRWRRVRQRAAGGRCPVRRPLGAGRVGTGRVFHPVSPRLDGKRSGKKKKKRTFNH